MALAAHAEISAVDRAHPVSQSADCRFEFIRDIAALEALGIAWGALDQRCGDSRLGFVSFGWIASWARRYAEPGRQLRVVAGYFEGRLAMVWPLIVRRSFGLTILEQLGEPLCQYHDAMLDPEAPAQALVRGALAALGEQKFDLIRLRRVRQDSALHAVLIEAGARIARTQTAPFVTLSPSPQAGGNSKSRANRRRRLRRLQEAGEITFEVAESPERADALITAALALKRDWALRHGSRAPAVFDPRFEACFRDAARSGDPYASLRVFAMLHSGRPIGIEISLAYRGRLFAHVLAHDCSLAKFGVGAVLADASIDCARAEGYEIFDLLAPADPYKTEWAHGEVEVNDILLAVAWPGAMFGALTTELGRAARAGIRRAPASLMRALVRRAERRRLDTSIEPR